MSLSKRESLSQPSWVLKCYFLGSQLSSTFLESPGSLFTVHRTLFVLYAAENLWSAPSDLLTAWPP